MLAIQPYDIKLRYKPGKTIPVADTLSRLHPADTDIELQVDMEILREKAQEAQSKHYNQHGRNMEPLKTGQKVWVQLTDQGTWKKATVCKTGDSPRSYYVRLEEGGTDYGPPYSGVSNTKARCHKQRGGGHGPAQAEQINHGRRAMATRSGRQVKPPTKLNL
ncbi:hypothetical protein QYM36_010242 [Artemia franciscana]|uniref:Uncharacterized protein n=1 Tax=Artemia franciscana TaxID=6661 RepID=A0AA88HWR4_ARTSF|nr:hypothetical protein QYM36_010242 [Artemia franciscana]